MKRILIYSLLAISGPALAIEGPTVNPPPKTYVLSEPMLQEIFKQLSTTSLLAMLAKEAQNQPPPVACPPAATEPIPPEPPAANQHAVTPGEAPK